MYAYALRRILLIPPTLLLVTILVFLSIRFVPGDVIDMMVAQMSTSGAGAGNPDRGPPVCYSWYACPER